MSKEKLTVSQTLSALRLSIAEGGFAQIYANLTGSVFLPGFALALNASPMQIGFLASLPFLANLAQFAGAYLIEKLQKRKALTILFAILGRNVWVVLVILSVMFADRSPALFLKFLVAGVLLSLMFGGMTGVSWLSWMAGLVPEEIRGRYFGLRNSLVGAAGITATLLGGLFLDRYPGFIGDFLPAGDPAAAQIQAFEILFAVAVVSGLISISFMFRQIEPPLQPPHGKRTLELFARPLRDRHFRRLWRYAIIRAFAVNIAAPFFVVYMLQDLRLSYVTVGLFTVFSSVADLVGMWIWGHISDHLGNRPVIIISSVFTALLPVIWLFTDSSPFSVLLLLPALHLFSGFAWSGYNLCAVNLVMRLIPGEGHATFFAFWSVFNGVAAGIGALLGGFISSNFDMLLPMIPVTFNSGFKLLFFISAGIRFVSLIWVRDIVEVQGTPMRQAVRVLWNVKSWASVMGFHPALHFFLPSRPQATTNHSPYWPIWGNRNIPASHNDTQTQS